MTVVIWVCDKCGLRVECPPGVLPGICDKCAGTFKEIKDSW